MTPVESNAFKCTTAVHCMMMNMAQARLLISSVVFFKMAEKYEFDMKVI